MQTDLSKLTLDKTFEKKSMFPSEDSSTTTETTCEIKNDDSDSTTPDILSTPYCLPCNPSNEDTTSKVPECPDPAALNVCHQALSTITEAHQQFTAIVDTGATRCCIFNKDEFETLKLRNYDYKLKGIATGLKIKGEGVVKYDVVDDQGKKVFTLKLRAYYLSLIHI